MAALFSCPKLRFNRSLEAVRNPMRAAFVDRHHVSVRNTNDHHIRVERINKGGTKDSNVTNNNLNVKLNTKDLLELLGKE